MEEPLPRDEGAPYPATRTLRVDHAPTNESPGLGAHIGGALRCGWAWLLEGWKRLLSRRMRWLLGSSGDASIGAAGQALRCLASRRHHKYLVP